MNSLLKSREFDLLCKHCIQNICRGGRDISVRIIEDWGIGTNSGLKRVYLKYCPYFAYDHLYYGITPWYLHYPQRGEIEGLTRQEREDALDSFQLLFEMLEQFGIKVTEVDVLGKKNKTDLLRFLKYERSAREKDDEKKHLERMEMERDAIFKGLPSLLEVAMEDILEFNQKIKYVDEKRYAMMCRGHLKAKDYTESLREMKSLTEKVQRYVPEIATFADKIASYDVDLAQSYFRISGRTIDDIDDGYHYKRMGHLNNGLSEFMHFYVGWFDTEDETTRDMVERTFNEFYKTKCDEIEKCIREEMGDELRAVKSATVDDAVQVILSYAKKNGRHRGAIAHLSFILGITKDEFNRKYI